jgi:hypothetical protein
MCDKQSLRPVNRPGTRLGTHAPTTVQKASGGWYCNEHGIWHRKRKDQEPGNILENGRGWV